MVTTLGTELGTILGTELGSLKDVYGFDTRLLYALSGFSAANYYQTLVGGGEVGSPGGFGAVVLLRRTGPLATSTPFMVGSNSNNGHAFYTDTSGYRWRTANGSAVFGYTAPSWTSPASDINCLDVHVGAYKPSSGLLQLWCSRDLRGSIAQTGYTAATAAAVIGYLSGNAFPGEIVGILTYRGEASDTQLRALFDITRTLRDLPPVFPQGSATDEDIAALAPRHWYRGDGYVPSGGNLGGLTNRNTTVGGRIDVAAGTVALPAADAAVNGQPSIALTGTQWLISNLPPSEFKFLHNNFESFFIYTPSDTSTSQVTIATTRPGDVFTTSGMLLQVGTTISTFRVGNGSGQVILTPDTPFALVNGTATYVNASYSETPTTPGVEYFFADKTVVKNSGMSTAAPSSADPYRTLVVGAGAVTFDGPLRGRIADILLFDRQLTEAERQKVRDYIRVRYGVGAITTTHRWSLRDVLAGLDLPVTDGQAAPASLPDTVTGATIDRMDRQGSPTVRVIDPSADGRKTYGALGFSATSRLQSTAGLLNTPTMNIELVVTFNTALTSGKHVLSNANGSGVVGGISLYQSASTLNLYSYGAGAIVASVSMTTWGFPRTIKCEYTGTVWRLWVDGVQQGADGAFSNTPSTLPLCIGTFGDGTAPADNVSIWSLRVGTYANPNLHFYDLTQDITANGGPDNGIPAQVQDRIGTDHLTRVGGLRVATSPATLITDFAGGNVYCGNALLGSPTFWASCLAVPGTLTGIKVLFGRADHSTGGWYFYLPNALVVATVHGTDGVGISTPSWTIPAGRLDTLVHIALRLTGGLLQLFIDGVPTGAAVAVVGYKSWVAGNMTVGATNNGNTYPAVSTGFAGGGGGDFAPSDAELLTHAQACLSAGVWQPIGGKTDTSIQIHADVADAGGGVPVMLKNRQTDAVVAVKVGAPLQVAQRAERLWSYETTPIFRGGSTWTSAAYYQAGPGVALGNPVGFWLAWLGVFPSGAAAATRQFASALGGAGGWDMRITGAMAALSWRMYDATPNGVTYTSSVVGAGDLDKLQMYVAVWDGPGLRQRAYFKRNEVGTGTARSGYTPSPTDTLRLGGVPAEPSTAGDLVQTYGFAYGIGVPTLAQVQALFDAVQANERMEGIPGMTDHLFNLTQDFASGATSATIADRQGSATLTRAGTPVYSERFVRAFGW